jgi:copper(I)-binding protein
MKIRLFVTLISSVLLVSMLAGCGPKAEPSISIEGAWGHPSPTIADAGVIFMLIKNSGNAPDKLLSGKSDACGFVELHEIVKKDNGTLAMNLVTDPVTIPTGGLVELKSDSLHVMCLLMKEDQFKIGSKINLTLVFEKSGEKTFSVEIREQ